MTSYCSGVSFPVVFFDGEYESNIGNITIHPSMNFHILQSILTQMIGISSHQFTVYRVNPSSADGRRNPITAKSNFAAIANDQDCFVLVVLKQSRKQRRRRTQHHNYQYQILQHDPDEYWNYLMMVSMMARNNGGCFSEYDEVVCGECRVAMLEGTSPEFHCCLYDPVVVDMFKTKAGAIARPVN